MRALCNPFPPRSRVCPGPVDSTTEQKRCLAGMEAHPAVPASSPPSDVPAVELSGGRGGGRGAGGGAGGARPVQPASDAFAEASRSPGAAAATATPWTRLTDMLPRPGFLSRGSKPDLFAGAAAAADMAASGRLDAPAAAEPLPPPPPALHEPPTATGSGAPPTGGVDVSGTGKIYDAVQKAYEVRWAVAVVVVGCVRHDMPASAHILIMSLAGAVVVVVPPHILSHGGYFCAFAHSNPPWL